MARKNGYAIIAAIVIAAAIIYGFLPKPVTVETMAVVRAPLMVTVNEEGKTRVIDRFVLSAPVTGTVLRSGLNVGDRVGKGQVVAEIAPRMSTVLDPRSRARAKARVKAASASLSAVRENLKAAEAKDRYAQSELKRIKRLHKEGYATEEQLEKSTAEARSSRAAKRSAGFAVKVARYELDSAKTTLEYSGTDPTKKVFDPVKITAPIDGRVLKLHRKSEGAVISGEELIEIGDPNALEVEIDVLSENAVRIAPGTRVLFKRWGGTKTLTGVVRVVEPTGFTKVSALGVDEQRVLVIADITSERKEWARLGDGYRVEASFILWQADNVLQLPASATFTRNGSTAVFLFKGSKALLTPVTFGHSSGLAVEVLEGVDEGERVITHPDDSIEDGSRVKAVVTQQ